MRGPDWGLEASDWPMELSGCYLGSQDLFGELDWTGPPGCPPVLYNMASSEVSSNCRHPPRACTSPWWPWTCRLARCWATAKRSLAPRTWWRVSSTFLWSVCRCREKLLAILTNRPNCFSGDNCHRLQLPPRRPDHLWGRVDSDFRGCATKWRDCGGRARQWPVCWALWGRPHPKHWLRQQVWSEQFRERGKKVEKLGVESEAGVRSGKFERGAVEELGVVAAETSEHQDVGRRVQCHHVGVRRWWW